MRKYIIYDTVNAQSIKNEEGEAVIFEEKNIPIQFLNTDYKIILLPISK